MKRVVLLAVILAAPGSAAASGWWATAGYTGDGVAGTFGRMGQRVGLIITAADTADDVRVGSIPQQDRPATTQRKQSSGETGVDALFQVFDTGRHALIGSVGFNVFEETTLTRAHRRGEAFTTDTRIEYGLQGGIFYKFQPRFTGLVLGVHSTTGAQAGLIYKF